MKNVTSILRGCCPKAILGIAVFTACTAFTSNASAQCSNMMAPKPYVAWLNELAAAPKPSHSLGTVKALAGSADPSIVGLWKVNYLAGGQVVNQAFEVFHDDGTELSVDTSAPASDNVCVGVWARTNVLTIKLNHPSWTFDDKGNLNGTATIKMDLTLVPNGNSFTGTFSVDVFDLSGNTLQHLTGTVAAKRITVD